MEEIKKIKQLIENLRAVRSHVLHKEARERIDHNIKIHEETIKQLRRKQQ